MRVYASKYLGHGIRVGVSENIRTRPPRTTARRGAQPIPRVPAPPAVRWLTLTGFVTFMVGMVFPPMLLITMPLLVALIIALIGWARAQLRTQRAAQHELEGQSR